jgi:hypothetical protein
MTRATHNTHNGFASRFSSRETIASATFQPHQPEHQRAPSEVSAQERPKNFASAERF